MPPVNITPKQAALILRDLNVADVHHRGGKEDVSLRAQVRSTLRPIASQAVKP